MQENFDPHDAFIATYASKTGVFLSSYLPLLILMGVVPIILLREDVRAFLKPEDVRDYFFLIAFFGGLLLLVFLESIMGIMQIKSGDAALTIDRNGVRGRHAYLARNFRWEDICEIYTKAGILYFAHRPRNILEKLTQSYTRPGERGRFETVILAPLENIDKSVEDINFAIQRYSPAGSRFAETTWSIPNEKIFHAGRNPFAARH